MKIAGTKVSEAVNAKKVETIIALVDPKKKPVEYTGSNRI
jgi:hypothetical protein